MVTVQTLRELRGYLIRLYDEANPTSPMKDAHAFSQRHFLGVIDALIFERHIKWTRIGDLR